VWMAYLGFVGGLNGGLDGIVVLVFVRLGWAFDQKLFDGSLCAWHFMGVLSSSRAQLSVFSASINYGVVKIALSSFQLQTTKNTMIYPGSGPSSKIITLCPVV
jgi:hypothetical protein